MKIIYVQGDLFQTDINVIVHSCNAKRRFGSGVAKLVRNKYPKAYEAYMTAPKLELGMVIWAEQHGKLIANLIGQDNYGHNPSIRYVSYDAIAQGMKTINETIIADRRVAMPMIGAGLGGGKWSIISAIIETECVDVQPYVFSLDGFGASI